MRRTVRPLLLGSAMLFAGACGGSSEEAAGRGSAESAPVHSEAGPAAAGPAAQHGHGSAATGTAHEALPLRPIMQRLAGDMAGFTHAVWLEDYEAMTAHSAAIADHPHIAPDEVRRIETELGPEMASFEAADHAVHEAAVRLHAAAEARRLDDVLEHLEEVQRGCVSCHVQFRERLRTDDGAAP